MHPARDGGRVTPPASDDPSPDDDWPSADPTPPARSGGVGGLLPDASVESRWWYWIAAVPVYFAFSLAFGGLLFGVMFLGFWVDAAFAVSGLFVFAVAAFFLALPGLALTVLFPVAVYVDARAVSEAEVGWHPDPVLYGLVALAGVLMTAFTVSVPMALYYLYRRHETVGVP